MSNITGEEYGALVKIWENLHSIMFYPLSGTLDDEDLDSIEDILRRVEDKIEQFKKQPVNETV